MPWEAEDVMDVRIRFVLEAEGRGKRPFRRVCEQFKISRTTGYLWWNRFQRARSVTGLAERSRRPQHSPRQTPEEVELQVVALRQHYGWGARKLEVLLGQRGYDVPEVTINRILKRRGLLHSGHPEHHATRRFARSQCNELVQVDFKGEYAVAEGKCYPLSLIDDCSRYLVALRPLSSQTAPEVQAALAGVFRAWGTPLALLLDHGTPWWSTTNGHGLTWLSVWLIKQGIRLIYAGVRHPQTQGKVERLHRTLHERTRHEGAPESLRAWQAWARRFRQEYNQVRPHEALQMKTPAQVYRRENLRPYLEPAPEWDYGEAQTRVLNPQGCLDYGGQRYFVCEALAEERVRLDELDDLLLVTFRAMTVREIDLRTGRTRAVVLPAGSARGQVDAGEACVGVMHVCFVCASADPDWTLDRDLVRSYHHVVQLTLSGTLAVRDVLTQDRKGCLDTVDLVAARIGSPRRGSRTRRRFAGLRNAPDASVMCTTRSTQ